MNICFVTLMFGLGLPVLFPIAVVSFAVLYLLEKAMLYYVYQMPPMYDERLSDSVINKLRWAPCFLLAFGYWMASSNQLISNEHLYEVEKSSSTRITDHYEFDPFTAEGWAAPAWPLLLFFWCILFAAFFGSFIRPQMEKCCPRLKIANFEVQQSIDNYFKSLEPHQRDWSTSEEMHANKKLNGLKILEPETLSKFIMTESNKTDLI